MRAIPLIGSIFLRCLLMRWHTVRKPSRSEDGIICLTADRSGWSAMAGTIKTWLPLRHYRALRIIENLHVYPTLFRRFLSFAKAFHFAPRVLLTWSVPRAQLRLFDGPRGKTLM